jgi:phosphoglycolate phosphatase
MATSGSLKLVLFDCDGTLVDSQHAIVDSMNAAWEAHGLGLPDANAVRRVVGLSLVEAIMRLSPQLTEKDACKVAETYKQAFGSMRHAGKVEEPLYDGMLETIEALSSAGYLLGVATGKSRRGLDAVLHSHGLKDRFVTLQTADMGPGKPNPHMVWRALDETGAQPADTVVIGDTTFDIQMARRAGASAIGVVWGYHEPEELEAAGAARLAQHPRDIPAFVSALLP